MGAVTSCTGVWGSSPVTSPVTGPGSEDFVKSCLFASIFAIYASRDASCWVFRNFKGRGLCSGSHADREKIRWPENVTERVMIVLVALSVSDETHRSGCVKRTPLSKRDWRRSKAAKPERQISGGFIGVRDTWVVVIIIYSTQSHETTSSASLFINWSISASRATFAISIWRTFEISSVHLVSKAVSCAPNVVYRTPVSSGSPAGTKDGAPGCFYGHGSGL